MLINLIIDSLKTTISDNNELQNTKIKYYAIDINQNNKNGALRIYSTFLKKFKNGHCVYSTPGAAALMLQPEGIDLY